jgi:hypothetical protein
MGDGGSFFRLSSRAAFYRMYSVPHGFFVRQGVFFVAIPPSLAKMNRGSR